MQLRIEAVTAAKLAVLIDVRTGETSSVVSTVPWVAHDFDGDLMAYLAAKLRQ